jgi:hypothetical protein
LDNEEQVVVSLRATSKNTNIHLENDFLKTDNTFIMLSSSKTIKIINKSDHKAYFKWTPFENQEKEEKYREADLLSTEKEQNILLEKVYS